MAADKYIYLTTGGALTEKSATQVGGGGVPNQIPALDAGGKLDYTMIPAVARVVRFYGSLAGKPSAAQELFAVEMLGDEVFPASLTSNVGKVGTAPTGSVTFSITVNGSSVGTMNVAAGATVATWVMASQYTATAGDIFAFYAPSSVDSTLQDLRYTFVGSR